jgi:uncharacterized membrane protein
VTPFTRKEIAMTPTPLHPAIVHLPLGLALLMPAVVLAYAWMLWTGRVRVGSWAVVVLLQALLVGAGLVAMNTGEHEEERVEAVVPEAALERHEERAAQFVWGSAATLAAAVLALVFGGPTTRRVLMAATVAGTVLVAYAAIRTGHAGGELVYVHNAGAAYGSATVARIPQPSAPGPRREGRQDR